MAPPAAEANATPTSVQDKLGMSLDEIQPGGDVSQRKRAREGAGEFQIGRRCYVGNMNYRTTWQELKDHFRQAGTVVFSKVMEEEDTGRSKGCGIVEFETIEEAMEAIETLHDSELNGRLLVVREDREDKELKGGGKGGGKSKGGGSETAKRIRPDERLFGNAPAENVGRKGGGGSVLETRRCYIGNLSYRTTWQTLKDHFRQAGNVIYSNVMEDEPGRSKGCGIVEYESAKEAARAIRLLHDSELDGRPILVREDREDKEVLNAGKGGKFSSRVKGGVGGGGGFVPKVRNDAIAADGSRRCYVGNLSYKTSWQDLKDYFRQAGNVVYSNVMKEEDGAGSRSKGCGIVEFETAREAAKAIRLLHDSELDGRPIFVREDREDKELGGKGFGKGKARR